MNFCSLEILEVKMLSHVLLCEGYTEMAATQVDRHRKPSRKDMELSPSGLPRLAAPPSKSSKTLLPLFKDAVIACCSLSPRSRRLAALYSTTRDHCGALGIIVARSQ